MTRLSFKLAFLPVLWLTLTTSLIAQTYSFHQYYNFGNDAQSNPCKPFIGVSTSNVSGGLNVDYTVDNTPAATYGVQAGDVILAMDGVPVHSMPELLAARNKHQAGDAFTLTLLRDGSEKTIKARFKECSETEMQPTEETVENLMAEKETIFKDLESFRNQAYFNTDRMNERPILGVYENKNVHADGLVIESVIPGKGAAAAGLREGDVVTKVDGKTITDSRALINALESHATGDQVKVNYIRDGRTMKTVLTLSAEQPFFSPLVERDPCKAFIGVTTSIANALNGRGTRVEGVLDATPAKEAGIQPGDVIMAFDALPVNSYNDLTRERDKKKAGDAFRLTISRNGTTMEIKARFKPCDAPSSTKEIVEVLPSEQREAAKEGENSLKIEVLDAYPNPTYGLVNIKFEAEAVPTTVQILDVTGKVVYNKNLPKFDGTFNEQVNLSSNNAGNYVLSIQQGDKVQTKQIVLLPRA